MGAKRKRKNREEEPRRKRGRGLIPYLIVIGFGAGMYFAGQARLFQPETQVATLPQKKEPVVKKIASSKPKRAFGAVLNREETRKEETRFTFFQTLNDPSLNKYVNLEGRVVKKAFSVVPSEKTGVTQVSLPSTPSPGLPEKTAQKSSEPVKEKHSSNPPEKIKVTAESQKKTPVQPEPVSSVVPEKPKEKKGDTKWVLDSLNTLGKPQDVFRVQVGAFQKFEQARELETRLKKGGYVAFIRAIEIPSKGTWYRVFLGQYESRKEAEREAALAGKKLGIRPVVKKAG